jgi:hypothetical protein
MTPEDPPTQHEQDLVDEALDETFPASDPISPMRQPHEPKPEADREG